MKLYILLFCLLGLSVVAEAKKRGGARAVKVAPRVVRAQATARTVIPRKIRGRVNQPPRQLRPAAPVKTSPLANSNFVFTPYPGRVIHVVRDLHNPVADQAHWSMSPPGLPKIAFCEGPKYHVLGGVQASQSVGASFWRTYQLPTPHVAIKISLQVIASNTIDGCGPQTPGWVCCGPDYYRIMVDNKEVVADCSMLSHKSPPFCNPTRRGGYAGDIAKNVYIRVPHTAPTATIHLVNNANQPLYDEAFGFNYLVVEVIGCPASCKTCASETTCASCHQSAILQNGKCVCKPGAKMLSASPVSCGMTCHASCDGCKQENVCLRCADGAKAITPNLCECKPGYKKVSGSPLKCQKIQCHPSCTLCSGPGANECLECPPNADLKTGGNGATCECKEGFHVETQTPLKCTKSNCDSTCKTCSGPAKNQCTSCKHTNAKLINGECNSCHPVCATCDEYNEFKCKSCGQNQDLVDQNGGKTCKCKNGFYSEKASPLNCQAYTCDKSCKECKGPKNDQCTSCPQDYELINGKCEKIICHPNCKTCSGSKDNQCTSCVDGATLKDTQNGKTCTCLETFKVASTSPLKCEKIPCHHSCDTCTGAGDDECASCRDGANLISEGSGKRCKCKEGFYVKVDKPLTCEKFTECHGSCKTCSGPNNNHCLTCPENSVLYELNGGQGCQCKPGFFEESKIPLKCKKIPCHFSCKICKGPEETTCLECWKNAELVKSEEGQKCECQPPNILWAVSYTHLTLPTIYSV
eukprot:TRINITY_DN1173_c0_g1_i10.p1 TRINITY_DN1173_c0_g1~~TRINITY_DN1173_c0_g1_i10.p1  ORF type:complete len:751 (-),score=71.85 TRINITY_DN1173_c0_g1_i10:72-2324(-)